VKCIYFLSPTLASTETVSEDLHAVGVKDFYLHVVSRDEAGLRQHRIHSSNYLETLDVIREGFIGAMLGFVAGLVGIWLLMHFKPLGENVRIPGFVYVVLAGAATLFGAWEGGLMGVDSENKKLARFHDDLVAGKYLILVYVRKHREEAVIRMMRDRHPDAVMVAIDRHFINPFSSVARITGAAGTRG
jgi:hypothetical protein